MYPIKTPNWIKWIVAPKYCFSVLRLRVRRQMATKEGRRNVLLKIYRWGRKNVLIGSVVLLTVQLVYERKWRREAELSKAEVESENSFIRGIVSMKNNDMKMFPYPWWEKVKKHGRWRFTDMNPAYETSYNKSKLDVLCKTNQEVFGDSIGNAYEFGDESVWKVPNRLRIDFEPYPEIDTIPREVMVVKYGRVNIYGDSVSSGFAVPVESIINLKLNRK